MQKCPCDINRSKSDENPVKSAVQDMLSKIGILHHRYAAETKKMHSELIDLNNLLRSIARKLHDPIEIHLKLELRTDHPFYMRFVRFGIVWF